MERGKDWLVEALVGLAIFVGGLVMWILRRTAAVDDREAAARAVYTEELRTIPSVLATQAQKLQAMKEALAALQRDVADLEIRVGVLADRAQRGES